MEQSRKALLFQKLFQLPSRWKNVLYLHSPFCLQRCKFCVYFSKVPENKAEILTFMEHHLLPQLATYEPALDATEFAEVYFGGGTPTMLPPEELNRLFLRIPNFRNIALKAIEASPRTIRDEHVNLFAQWGFSYVSIGVQTFDERTLREQNREIVDMRRLAHVVERLEAAGIIVNVDLIFFLASGTTADLEQARTDLRRVIEDLRPISITIHSEYNASKTQEKQTAMIRLIREELERSAEYICTNSLLCDADAPGDMKDGAEYRLLRAARQFSFYLLGKVPQALRFGYNILAVGEYEFFKLRSNYYYVSDFYPRHASAEILARSRSVEAELATVRRSLGLIHPNPEAADDFFATEQARVDFGKLIHAEGFPPLPGLHAAHHA